MPDSLLPHVPTLVLSTVSVAAMLGIMLFCTWLQDRTHRALLWWSPAYLLIASGTSLLALRGVIPDLVSTELANALIILGVGSLWNGVRAFEGRSEQVMPIVVAAGAWVIICQHPVFATDVRLRIVLASVTLGGFLVLSARELFKGRSEKLVSRWPAIIVLSAYAAAMFNRIPLIYLVELPSPIYLFRSPWFGVMAFGTLLFTTTLAFLFLAMTKERTELVHRRDALLDPLTGLLNRRAFLAAGERALARLGSNTVSVLVLDLDGFKQINDRFGHPAGDHVLTLFGRVTRDQLREDDTFGRIGGEEFAALLVGCDEARATEVAERIRLAFAGAARELGVDRLDATVSVGVATVRTGDTLSDLLANADRAVYRAKAQGRDRVSVFDANKKAELFPALRPVEIAPPRAA